MRFIHIQNLSGYGDDYIRDSMFFFRCVHATFNFKLNLRIKKMFGWKRGNEKKNNTTNTNLLGLCSYNVQNVSHNNLLHTSQNLSGFII